VSERRACELLGLSRSVRRYTLKVEDSEVVKRIKQIAKKHRRYGYRRIHDTLIKERVINHKKVYRLYTILDLKYRRKRKKRSRMLVQSPIIPASERNQRWSMDFMSDSLYGSRRFRILNIIDDFGREAILGHADLSISGVRLVRLMDRIKETRPLPRQIVVDNGPEFTSKAFLEWADKNHVDIHFIDKGKPTQNALIESYNGKFRDECLNEHWFQDIKEARIAIQEWLDHYNTDRPHSSLGGLSPYEFIEQSA
jgi:putative transposase